MKRACWDRGTIATRRAAISRSIRSRTLRKKPGGARRSRSAALGARYAAQIGTRPDKIIHLADDDPGRHRVQSEMGLDGQGDFDRLLRSAWRRMRDGHDGHESARPSSGGPARSRTAGPWRLLRGRRRARWARDRNSRCKAGMRVGQRQGTLSRCSVHEVLVSRRHLALAMALMVSSSEILDPARDAAFEGGVEKIRRDQQVWCVRSW